MSVLDDNVVLGLCPCFKTSSQPSYIERFFLLLLFFISGLFCDQIMVVAGPTCRSLYEEKCPEPYFKQEPKPPFHLLGNYLQRRLLEDTVEEEQEERVAEEVALKHPLERGPLGLATFIMRVSEGQAAFNCTMPMCDIFAPGDISREKAARFTHFDAGGGMAAISYIPGYCRCSRSASQFLSSLVLVLLFQALVQTCIVEFYVVALTTSWDNPRLGCVGSCTRCLDIAVKMSLFILMAGMLVIELFVAHFDANLLLISVGAMALQVVTVQLLKSYLKCVILKKLGCSKSDKTYNTLPTQDRLVNREIVPAPPTSTNCCTSAGCSNEPWSSLFGCLPRQNGVGQPLEVHNIVASRPAYDDQNPT